MFHCIQLRQAYPLQVPFFPLFLITYFTFSFQLIFHSRQFWWTIYSINGNRMNELFQLQNPSDDEDLELLLKLLKGITDLSITKLRILDTPTILQHFPYLTQSCYVGAHKFYKWIISYNRFGLVNSWIWSSNRWWSSVTDFRSFKSAEWTLNSSCPGVYSLDHNIYEMTSLGNS